MDELVDLSGVDLSELRALDDTVLADAMRRIRADVERQAGAIAGWQSVITRPPSE